MGMFYISDLTCSIPTMTLPLSPEHRREVMKIANHRGVSYSVVMEEVTETLVALSIAGAQQHVHSQAINIVANRANAPEPAPVEWFGSDSHFRGE